MYQLAKRASPSLCSNFQNCKGIFCFGCLSVAWVFPAMSCFFLVTCSWRLSAIPLPAQTWRSSWSSCSVSASPYHCALSFALLHNTAPFPNLKVSKYFMKWKWSALHSFGDVASAKSEDEEVSVWWYRLGQCETVRIQFFLGRGMKQGFTLKMVLLGHWRYCPGKNEIVLDGEGGFRLVIDAVFPNQVVGTRDV